MKEREKLLFVFVILIFAFLAGVLQAHNSRISQPQPKISGMVTSVSCDCVDDSVYDYEYCPPPNENIIKSCSIIGVTCTGGSTCTAHDVDVSLPNGTTKTFNVNKLGPYFYWEIDCPGQTFEECPRPKKTSLSFWPF